MNPELREVFGYALLFLIFTGLTGSLAGGLACIIFAAILIEILMEKT
jgi:hypothetical protein